MSTKDPNPSGFDLSERPNVVVPVAEIVAGDVIWVEGPGWLTVTSTEASEFAPLQRRAIGFDGWRDHLRLNTLVRLAIKE